MFICGLPVDPGSSGVGQGVEGKSSVMDIQQGKVKDTAGVEKRVLGDALTQRLEPWHGENGLAPWRESESPGRWV